MPDYSKSKIYSIRSHQTDLIYIGSTIQTLALRLSGHVRDFKNFKNGKGKYITSFDMLKFEDYYIELICDFPCTAKAHLLKKEGGYIRSMKCVNKLIPGRTRKQYKLDNKEKISKYQKQYQLDNKEKIIKYLLDNKEKRSEQRKNYYLNNVEKISEKKKQYYLDNKEIRDLKRKEKYNCVCGSSVQSGCKSEHFKSKKHLKYISART